MRRHGFSPNYLSLVLSLSQRAFTSNLKPVSTLLSRTTPTARGPLRFRKRMLEAAKLLKPAASFSERVTQTFHPTYPIPCRTPGTILGLLRRRKGNTGRSYCVLQAEALRQSPGALHCLGHARQRISPGKAVAGGAENPDSALTLKPMTRSQYSLVWCSKQ